MSSLGNKIRQARIEKGLTQAELAGNVISRSLLSLLENGQSNPSMQTLEYIANKLQKPVSFFLSNFVNYNELSDQLIADSEILLEAQEYSQIIEKIERFFKETIHGKLDLLDINNLGTLVAIIGISHYSKGHKEACSYLKDAVAYLEQNNNSKYLYKTYTCLSHLMFKSKDYKGMEYYSNKANNSINQITYENVYQKLNTTYNLSLACYYQQKYDSAIEVLKEALTHSKKYEIYYNFGEFNILLALAYRNIADFDNAISSNLKAIDYYKLTENNEMIYQTYINISIVYRYLSNYYASIKYINEAINYFQSISINKNLATNAQVEKIVTMFMFGNDQNIISSLVNATINNLDEKNTQRGELLVVNGYLEYKTGNLRLSLDLFIEAEKILENTCNSSMTFFMYHGLSKLYETLGETDKAYKYLEMLDTLTNSKPYYKSSVWENFFKHYFV